MVILPHPVLITSIGSLLETNLIKAMDMASKQRKAADDFTATFPPDTVQQWKRMVREWEADSSRPNPYISKDRGRLLCPVSNPVTHSFFISFESVRNPVATCPGRGR